MWSRNRMAIHYFFFVSFNSICFVFFPFRGWFDSILDSRRGLRCVPAGGFRRRSSLVFCFVFLISDRVSFFFSVLFYSRIPKLTEPLKKTQAAAAEAFSFIRSFIHFIRRRRWEKKKISVHSKRNCFHNSFILSNRFYPKEWMARGSKSNSPKKTNKQKGKGEARNGEIGNENSVKKKNKNEQKKSENDECHQLSDAVKNPVTSSP